MRWGIINMDLMGISSNKNILIIFIYPIQLSMNTPISVDQNKRKVQQKYQRFKASQLANLNILTQVDQNKPNQTPKCQQDNLRQQLTGLPTQSQQPLPQISMQSQDRLYMQKLTTNISNNQPRVLSFMLNDPRIQQISESIKSQFQNRNVAALLHTFPERYRQLLQAQANLHIMQKTYKQKCADYNKQIKILMQKLLDAENAIRQSKEQMNSSEYRLKSNYQRSVHQYEQLIKNKEVRIFNLQDELEETKKKYERKKQQYKNASEVIIELREQQANYRRQTQRLVEKIKCVEQKLVNAHKRLLQYDQSKQRQEHNVIVKSSYEQKIRQLADKNTNLEQLLQQATVRVQYKQSLLQLSQSECEKRIKKSEEQLQNKYNQLHRLRKQHLQALQTIDMLQYRINSQQESMVREVHVKDNEKEQVKRELQKYHKLNAQMKVELQSKNQLIAVLEKSIRCIKQTHQAQRETKSKQCTQFKEQLTKLRQQYEMTKLQNQGRNHKQLALNTQIANLNKAMENLKQQNQRYCAKIQSMEPILRRYLEQIVLQQDMCMELKYKVQDWIFIHANFQQQPSQSHHILATQQLQVSKVHVDLNEEDDVNDKLSQYQKIIQKLKEQILQLMKCSRQKHSKQAKIFHELIQQNKRLKLQIQSDSKLKLKQRQKGRTQNVQATKISLFGHNKYQ